MSHGSTYDLMLSQDLRQILLLKMPFFVRQKMQISSKILPQIQNFANFVKFYQKSILSSLRPVFVMLSVFRQKRNPLKPINQSINTHLYRMIGCKQISIMHYF